ncbi:uncharacterized protein BCR38DRAFT_415495 [Pseudomassariella vexata]|uniref:Uncharacterized protein n=1 Tax=Pseudomassariella vexata TaxID=1141098 RepID=A0A1Y2EH84_9PEZI|nr:uncharacterized protein BCR38DRAFT_415495 [Pseudomassariella vexata]ORY70931.1 hypothetical protein BCR38DRAFT_415495 [Pseudomassariella vexata]
MAKQSSFVVCLLAAFLAFAPTVLAVIDKWTPEGFDWSAHDAGHPDTWNGLYHNLSDPSVAVSKAVMTIGQVRTAEDGTVVLAIPFFLGVAYQVFNLALTGVGLAGAIQGCVQNEGKPENILYCVGGILSTIVGVGGIASAAKKLAQSRGFLGVAANAWDQSGLENIALNVFQKRGIEGREETAQKAHNYFIHRALSNLAAGEVEFVGYAPDNHRLALRDSMEHPFAPMFRFEHKRYGKMELTSRDTGGKGIAFTVSYAGHPTHLATMEKRDEYYQHERLSSSLMEGRFDSSASLADPADIEFDGAGAFNQIETAIECGLGDSWPDGNVMSVQMYDQANEATFGFASIGLFADNSVDSGLEDFEPTGLPLTNCN